MSARATCPVCHQAAPVSDAHRILRHYVYGRKVCRGSGQLAPIGATK